MIVHQEFGINSVLSYYRSLCNIHPFLTMDIVRDLDYVKCRISEYPELYSQLLAISAVLMGVPI